MPNHYPASSLSQSRRERSQSRETDGSSHFSGSREPSPSEHSSSSEDETKQSKQSLPSLREFCSGLLPSSGSALDGRIRDLGIGQPLPPLPPLRSLSTGHSSGRLYSKNAQHQESRMMTSRTSSSNSHYSPYHYTHGLPRMAHTRSTSHSSHDDLSYGGENPGAASSIDSDSDDDNSTSSRPLENPRTCLLKSQRAWPQVYYRSRSFDSNVNFALSPIGNPSSSAGQQLRPAFPVSDHKASYQGNGSREVLPGDDLSNHSWEEFAENVGRLGGSGPVMFTCRWRKDDNQPCNYTGKKQLAKRHVESVHLGRKPHECPICKKPFPQKTSLDIHVRSVHTFDKPIKCNHCSASFSDPARRHKHLRTVHPHLVVAKPRTKLEFEEIKHLFVK